MFSIRVSGTKVNDNTRYQNPLDLSEKDPELLEIGAPEYAGNIFLKYQIGSLSLGWQSQFISEMLLGNGPEVETYETLFGPSVLMDDMWIHDFNGSYAIQDNVNLSFGVRNVTEEEPFITANAYPLALADACSGWDSTSHSRRQTLDKNAPLGRFFCAAGLVSRPTTFSQSLD